MKGKEKLIGAIIAIALAIAGAVFGFNSEEFKAEICGPKPSPSPQVIIPAVEK